MQSTSVGDTRGRSRRTSRSRGRGAAGHRAGIGSRTVMLPCVGMATGVGSTSSTGVISPIPSAHRHSSGMSGRHHLTSGSRCLPCGPTTTNKSKFRVHMNKQHRATSTGASRLRFTVQVPGVSMGTGAQWGNTVC